MAISTQRIKNVIGFVSLRYQRAACYCTVALCENKNALFVGKYIWTSFVAIFSGLVDNKEKNPDVFAQNNVTQENSAFDIVTGSLLFIIRDIQNISNNHPSCERRIFNYLLLH